MNLPKANTHHRFERMAVLSISVVLLVYSGLKANTMSITGDEASSYLDLCFMKLGYFFGGISNTHWFNSIWMKLISYISPEPFALRFFSVICGPITFYYLYKTIKELGYENRAWWISLIVFLNPYVIDFFSLARGYAPAMASSMISLFFAARYFSTRKVQYFNYACYSSLFAALNAFTLLNFHVIWLFLFLKESELSIFANVKKHWLFWMIQSIGTFLIIAVVIQYKGLEAAFPEQSFFPEAWFTVIKASLGFEFIYPFVSWLSLMLIAISFFVYSYRMKKNSFQSAFYWIVAGIPVLHIIQHYVIGAAYPSMRSLVYYYPLVVLFICLTPFSWRQKNYTNYVGWLVLGCMVFNFAKECTLYSSKEADWAYDFYPALKVVKSESRNQTISLGVSGNYYNQANYYALIHKEPWLNIGHGFQTEVRNAAFYSIPYTTGNYDYLILEPADLERANDVWKLKLVRQYPLTKISIWKVEK